MTQSADKPDYILETSWEVCNPVGGIYTVLSTKAKTLCRAFGDRALFIGPDLRKESVTPYFTQDDALLADWRAEALRAGIPVRVGRWNVPGSPAVVLVDHTVFFSEKDELFGRMWEWFGVDSLEANGDYDESCVFAYAAGRVVESLYPFIGGDAARIVAHFDEWTTGMGLLYVKRRLPRVATLFTTHATCMGRSIAGNGKPLYDYLPGYFGDQMARELNMTAKHGLEKRAAREADCFTTVSEITADECTQLLERTPDVVTPNGFESGFVPKGAVFTARRNAARKRLLKSAAALIGYTPSEEVFLVATSGRYEYRNKGIDLYIESLRLLQERRPERETIAFVLVPAWVDAAREELRVRMESEGPFTTPLGDPFLTHTLHNFDSDSVVDQLRRCGLTNRPGDRVKVLFVPAYLRGDDGIFDTSYYDLLAGFDATAFPSYYEPWGYTPLESVAFGIPTVTTDLSGFGRWVLSLQPSDASATGVVVLHRTDANFDVVARQLADTLSHWSRLTALEKEALDRAARSTARQAAWSRFFPYYRQAYRIALGNAAERTNTD